MPTHILTLLLLTGTLTASAAAVDSTDTNRYDFTYIIAGGGNYSNFFNDRWYWRTGAGAELRMFNRWAMAAYMDFRSHEWVGDNTSYANRGALLLKFYPFGFTRPWRQGYLAAGYSQESIELVKNGYSNPNNLIEADRVEVQLGYSIPVSGNWHVEMFANAGWIVHSDGVLVHNEESYTFTPFRVAFGAMVTYQLDFGLEQ